MISGIGEPGEWNGYHFKSPSVLDVGDFLLVAYEGWEAARVASGIGLMIGVERWIQSTDRIILLNNGNGFRADLTLGNHGAGELRIHSVAVSNPAFRLALPVLPVSLKPSEPLLIPVEFTPSGQGGITAASVTIQSDSMIDPVLTLYFVAY